MFSVLALGAGFAAILVIAVLAVAGRAARQEELRKRGIHLVGVAAVNSVTDGRERYASVSDRDFYAFSEQKWRESRVDAALNLDIEVDGQRALVHSFTRRDFDSFYVNLKTDGDPRRKTFVFSHHKWSHDLTPLAQTMQAYPPRGPGES